MINNRAVIFVNGVLPEPKAVLSLIHPGDLLIAADGGLRHIKRLGLTPHVLIGDLDSVSPQDILALQNSAVQVERYPVDKNETDLELALLYACRHKCQHIVLIGALGGRLDQTLGNISLLLLPELAGLDVRLDDGIEEVFFIRTSAALDGQPGDTVSLLPWNGPVQGVTTHHMRYPLFAETLYPEHTRGISNVIEDLPASVQISSGLLLCIHTRKSQKGSADL
jgi:thiamine pyrophosphokinase